MDRNDVLDRQFVLRLGRAFTGAWIETIMQHISAQRSRGRAFTGAWIETAIPPAQLRPFGGRAFTGAWIETANG